jgi:hypothetical protein
MLARLRNSTIALLGVVTVVGLGLVAFISQLGLPGVFNGEIPDGPSGTAAVHGAVALTGRAPVARRGARFPGHRVSARVRSSSPGRPDPAIDAEVGSSNQAGHGPTREAPSATPPPPSAPAPEPAGETETPPPAPTAGSPEPGSPAQPKEQSSAKPSPKAEDHSQGQEKDHPQGQAGAGTGASLTGESQGHPSAKAKRPPGASTKPSKGSPGKSGGSDTGPSKPSSPPPPSQPAEKKPPEAGGKGPGGAGKSDKSHH